MDLVPVFAELHDATPVINPSLLACDFGNIEAEVHRCEAAGLEFCTST